MNQYVNNECLFIFFIFVSVGVIETPFIGLQPIVLPLN